MIGHIFIYMSIRPLWPLEQHEKNHELNHGTDVYLLARGTASIIWRMLSNREKSCGDVKGKGLIAMTTRKYSVSTAHKILTANSSQTY